MADILSIGISGLTAAKKSLETVGHNISNATTEGYSKQRAHQTTSMPLVQGGMVQGTGTRISRVSRLEDQFIERRLNTNISKHEFFKERAHQLEQAENIFNEIDGQGLNKIINSFFNAFRDLANQPENETIRSVVRDKAGMIVKDFHRIRETLDDVARNMDKKIHNEVETINETIKKIARLNKEIVSLEVTGEVTGDLRDQRDLAVRNLSESFHVTTYYDNRNNFVVSAQGVGTLVAAAEVQELIAVPKSKAESSNDMAGSMEISLKRRPATIISNKFSNGKLDSLLKTRNEDISQLQKDIDSIAFNFTNTVNAIHRQGHVNRTITVDANGNPITHDKTGPTTGINFFKTLDQTDDASLNIELSDAVKENLTNITTAKSPNSPGDNRIALAISKIQHEKILDDGTTTLEEKYLQTIGSVGLKAGKARLNSEHSEGLLTQMKTIKERLTAVSLDEEAADMVRFQHNYDASAKVLQVASETFDKIMEIM